MPELPEVETVRRDLAPKVVGLTITGLEVTWPKALRGALPEAMKKALVGREIVDLARRAKYLLFRLDDGRTLVIHLKLTGALLWTEGNCRSAEPYIRTVIYLDRGCIEFRDPRKFGSLWLVENEAEFLKGLGPEPLEKSFTGAELEQVLKKRSAPVKAVLLDQGAIAGLGNMYADEALFQAKVHPLKKASELTRSEIKLLHRAIRSVLRKGIEAGGASVATYFRPDGSRGYSQEQFKVAHNRGGTCPRCRTPLEYIKVRGRGTSFCPHCQTNHGPHPGVETTP